MVVGPAMQGLWLRIVCVSGNWEEYIWAWALTEGRGGVLLRGQLNANLAAVSCEFLMSGVPA